MYTGQRSQWSVIVLFFQKDPPSFFFFFGYDQGKKRPSWQTDKSLPEKKTLKAEEIKKENPETIFDSDSPTGHTTRERCRLSDLVKGKAGVSAHPNKRAFIWVFISVWKRERMLVIIPVRSNDLCSVSQQMSRLIWQQGRKKTETTVHSSHTSDSKLFTLRGKKKSSQMAN